MNKSPMVSVIVPVYNRVKYLEQSIDSILKQDYKDLEIIIIDDGSTENITEDLEKCVKKAPEKIRFLRQSNRGPAGARNTGIKQASGKYIAFLDADDEWEEQFLSKGIEKIISGKYQWVETAGFRIVLNDQEEVLDRTIISAQVVGENDDLYAILLKNDIIGNPSKVIVEKECFEKAGYFREDLRIREDWEMWLRLARAQFKYYRIQEPLTQYKIRENSLTRVESLRALRCTYQVLCEYSAEAFKKDATNRILYAEQMWDLARHVINCKEKDYPLFLKCFYKSQLFDPSFKRVFKSLRSMTKRQN